MAHQASQAKLGFFPAPPDAIAGILSHLRVSPPTGHSDPKRDSISILDPCCGEGLAIAQIRDGLGVGDSDIFAIELDDERGESAAKNLPGSTVVAPASFHGMQITGFAFGLAYVNSPFDSELGGGQREEQSFIERAYRLLMTDGILILVCPATTLGGNYRFVDFLDSHLHDCQIYRFPDHCRKYKEVVLFARARKEPIPKDGRLYDKDLHTMGLSSQSQPPEFFPVLGSPAPEYYERSGWAYVKGPLAEGVRSWEIPRGWKPWRFKKIQLTDKELEKYLTDSPLNIHFRQAPAVALGRPPLPLDRGHLGLILASGMLDGDIHGPHGSHVARGSNYKSEYRNLEESGSVENEETGAVTTKIVYSQKIVTVLRCVDESGVIYTHSNDDDSDDDKEDAGDGGDTDSKSIVDKD